MSETNKDAKTADNSESVNPQSESCDCGSGCACKGDGSTGGKRWIVGVIVLIAAGALVARAMVKNNSAPTAPASTGFATLAVPAQTLAPEGAVASTDTVTVVEIGAFSDLNMVAVGTDGVFVYLPGTNGIPGQAPAAQIRAAAKTIEAQARIKMGIFTLKTDSRDYAQMAAQIPVPGVVAMVKGKGMAPVSGELSEAKLIQGFVAASSAGGCGPASGGCGPATAGCQ